MILSVILFDVNGTTAEKHLGTASNINWVDDIDAEGSFSFNIPLEDIGTMEIGSVVKFALGDNSTDYVFGGSVEDIKIEKIGESSGGIARTVQVTGRGLKARLADAVVYPVGDDNARVFTNESAGAIFKTLFDEAQARGALTGFSLNFTDTTDSNSEAFTELLTIDVSVGSTLLEVANGHQEIAADNWVDPDLTINYANNRGTDLTTGTNPLVLRAGESVSEIVVSQKGPITNTVLVNYEAASGGTYTTKNDSTSVSNFGRREGYLSLATTFETGQVDSAALRALEKTANASNSKTINIDSNGPVPYIDFNVGDIIFLADIDGTRESFRIRSVSVTEDAAGNISFVPELGTTRANLDKRLANALARIEKGTLDSEFSFDNSELDGLGGGAILESGTVTTGASTTLTGNVNISGVGVVSFTNATSTGLAVGDTIVVVEVDTLGYVAVGVLSRSGTTTPVPIPGISLSPNFPLQTDNLPFPIYPTHNGTLINDMLGDLGLSTDAILASSGIGSATRTVNGFVRSSATSLSYSSFTGLSTTTTDTYYMQPGGRIIVVEYSTNIGLTPQLRYFSSGTWTTFVPTNTGTRRRFSYDNSNGYMWIAVGDSSNDYEFYRFGPADAAPVNVGQLGTGTSRDNTAWLVAEHGKLAFSSDTGTVNFWLKDSDDSNNFVSQGTFSTSSFLPINSGNVNDFGDATISIDSFGNVYTFALISPSYRISKLEETTCIITSTDTGLNLTGSTRRPSIYSESNGGRVIIPYVCREDYYDPVSGLSTRWLPTIAVHNFTPGSTFVFADTAVLVDAETELAITRVSEISTGTIRFGVKDIDATVTPDSEAFVYELTGF